MVDPTHPTQAAVRLLAGDYHSTADAWRLACSDDFAAGVGIALGVRSPPDLAGNRTSHRLRAPGEDMHPDGCAAQANRIAGYEWARNNSPGDYHRGYRIERRDGVWVYCDTGSPVAADPDRACGHCGRLNTPEGHDGCLGTIPGARNACCGHGRACDAYVQFDDSTHDAMFHASRERAVRWWVVRDARAELAARYFWRFVRETYCSEHDRE